MTKLTELLWQMGEKAREDSPRSAYHRRVPREDPEVAQAVEAEADTLARDWLTQTRVARKGVSDERQVEYDSLESMSTMPEPISLTTPKNGQTDTKVRYPNGTEGDLSTREMHLLASVDGAVLITLNEWERKVLDSEASQTGFQDWYRNPDRAVKESLAVACKDGVGDWKVLRSDFIFFGTNRDESVAVDLVDPHGSHLSDVLPETVWFFRLRRAVRK